MGVLVKHLNTHHLEGRQDAGQRHRRTDPDDLESHAIRVIAFVRVPVECELRWLQSVNGERVVDCHRSAKLLLVSLWKGRRVLGEEGRCLRLPEGCDRRLREEVLPALRRAGKPLLEYRVVDLGHGRAGRNVNDVVEPREH